MGDGTCLGTCDVCLVWFRLHMIYLSVVSAIQLFTQKLKCAVGRKARGFSMPQCVQGALGKGSLELSTTVCQHWTHIVEIKMAKISYKRTMCALQAACNTGAATLRTNQEANVVPLLY